MPELICTTVYQFPELSDAAKEKARSWYRELGPHDDWWDAVYEDFERVCKILGIRPKTTPVRLMNDDLAASLAPGGRLDTLLGAAEFATSTPVDPDGQVTRALCQHFLGQVIDLQLELLRLIEPAELHQDTRLRIRGVGV